MSPSDAATIRRGRPEDVEKILDLLAFYERPRGYFDPFYSKDPTYRPEHSWIAERDGRPLAHLRVFDRTIRVGEAELRVAAVGNVITAPDQRGRGHAGRLLDAMLAEIPGEGFAYSLLRAYRPALYERHGWAPIGEEVVRAELPPFGPGSVSIEPFGEHDLPEVMRLYEETNAGRSGPAIRPPEYWHGQLEWLEEDRGGFLVARRRSGTLAGYVRSRTREDAAEILELGIRAGDVGVGRALLLAAAGRRGNRIRANLPPSLRGLVIPTEGELVEEFALMGRVIDPEALVAALEPAWLRRMETSGSRGGSFRLSTRAGTAEVRASFSGVRVYRQETEGVRTSLGERAFAHLLLRGFDAAAGERVGTVRDPSLLAALFPEQDFVVWRADAF
ncbi:MAG: GNAT family N-acetyltransferase [Actinomycetota bacterium]|nr:GNAT family N-acetyltransferase [Actinomycetota bacterium]